MGKIGKALIPALSTIGLIWYLGGSCDIAKKAAEPISRPAKTIGYNTGLGDIANRTDISDRIKDNLKYKARTGLAVAEDSYGEAKNDAYNLGKDAKKRLEEGLRTYFGE